MGATLVCLFTVLAAVCALLTISVVHEVMAARRVAASTHLNTNGATVAMLSDATSCEDEKSWDVQSFDVVLTAAKSAQSSRRLAVAVFFLLVLPTIW